MLPSSPGAAAILPCDYQSAVGEAGYRRSFLVTFCFGVDQKLNLSSLSVAPEDPGLDAGPARITAAATTVRSDYNEAAIWERCNRGLQAIEALDRPAGK